MYFVVAEALSNVVKHSQATRAQVTVVVANRALRVEVRDDGIGGADPEGHGLQGMADTQWRAIYFMEVQVSGRARRRNKASR